MIQGMNDLVDLSREYGSDPRWVIAGGGNTSLKEGSILYVKASGFPLATIDEGGFARMDRNKLAAIWDKSYPDGDDGDSVALRERLVLADMMDSRMPDEERRPSVETQLHDLLPWPLVVHLHPTLVNGLTCAVDGQAQAAALFGEKQMWIPVTDPGYVLAKAIRDRLADRRSQGFDKPDYILLENHGIFVGGSDAPEVRGKYARLIDVLSQGLSREPAGSTMAVPVPADLSHIADKFRNQFGPDAPVQFIEGGELEHFIQSGQDPLALTGCLTPDHIVYAGPGALYLEGADSPDAQDFDAALTEYRRTWGKPPHIVVLPEYRGALIAALNEKKLANVKLLFDDALKLVAYSESFGGMKTLPERFVRFIVDWEVENYRSSV